MKKRQSRIYIKVQAAMVSVSKSALGFLRKKKLSKKSESRNEADAIPSQLTQPAIDEKPVSNSRIQIQVPSAKPAEPKLEPKRKPRSKSTKKSTKSTAKKPVRKTKPKTTS